MTICGTCVCPTSIPTPTLGDFCVAFNESYALCRNTGNIATASISNVFFTGVIMGVVLVVVYYIVYKLFIKEELP
jgi:hypothetical protein